MCIRIYCSSLKTLTTQDIDFHNCSETTVVFISQSASDWCNNSFTRSGWTSSHITKHTEQQLLWSLAANIHYNISTTQQWQCPTGVSSCRQFPGTKITVKDQNWF